jgi:myo-inositol 2-dehydrogenase / D-chiro-inositol 1-dehydrogenase
VHRNKQAPEGFRSEMLVRDSLVHEVDITRWLFGEEITRITVHAPVSSSAAPAGVTDPQFAVLELRSGALADVEVFVNSSLGYEVRCEAVAERGTATVGLGSGPVVRTDGRWAGVVPDDYRVRFAAAYDVQVQRWADAARRGEVDGPTAWDGYAAVAVCEAGVQSLRSGGPVSVDLADRNEVLS